MKVAISFRWFLVVAVISSLAFVLPKTPANHTEAAAACGLTNTTFQNGEELTYVIYYNLNAMWVSAGEVSFKATDIGTQYLLSATGKSYSSYDWFFKVRDEFTAYVDKKTMYPYVSVRNVQEGGYAVYDRVTFDQSAHKATSKRGRTAKQTETKQFELGDCMHDVLSVLFYVRNLDFQHMTVNSSVPVKVFLDQETYPLSVKYLGKETRSIKDNGKYNTIHLSPEVVTGGVFKPGSQMHVWATDDANRVPLLIESPIRVGAIKCVLKSTKNLRYPNASKIK